MCRKKGENMKKIIVFLMVTILITNLTSFDSNAALDSNADYVDILIEHGYTKETAEVLPVEAQKEIVTLLVNSPDKVNISVSTLEIDHLTEIETLFSLSQQDISDKNYDEMTVEKEKQKYIEYSQMSDFELAECLEISEVEANLIKKAVNQGIQNSKNGISEDKKSGVYSSGYVSSSELYYVQTVTDISNTTLPSYNVTLSYSWTKVTTPTGYRDIIAAAWGGGLNSKNYDTTVRYHNWNTVGGSFGTLYTEQDMVVNPTPSVGVEFNFPQSYDATTAQNKTGYAKFNLYQTKSEGKETSLVSEYCYAYLGVGRTVSISALPSINVGQGFKTSYPEHFDELAY